MEPAGPNCATSDRNEIENPVLLFDGVCNLCNGAVRFIIRRDPRAVIRFAPLQSEVGRDLLGHYGFAAEQLETLLLIEEGRSFVRSDAALRVARHLRFPWPAAGVLRLVPRPIRDAVYRWIARNRYRWFGRQAECMLPTPEYRARFLQAGREASL